jgi:hypothetical protein
MIKKTLCVVVFLTFGLFMISIMQTLEAQEESQELLTPEDIEEVTGMQEIKLLPKNEEKGAVGDLNFATEDETLILMVNIQAQTVYEAWKNQEGIFHSEVQGVGDEAFIGPKTGDLRYIMVFRKGEYAVSFSSYFETEEEPFFSEDQLKEVASIVDSRL